MKLIVPLGLAIAGAGAGVGAGILLRPDAGTAGEHAPTGAEANGGEAAAHTTPAEGGNGAAVADPRAMTAQPAAGTHGGDKTTKGGEEYVSLGNRFIVPILDESRVRSMVVLSIDVEVGRAGSSTLYRVEPKLRDAFLTVLFDHANAGGFSGTFTSSGAMEILRRSLREAGQKAVGQDVVADVLITGIVRQDV